jgi:hypothetical protein
MSRLGSILLVIASMPAMALAQGSGTIYVPDTIDGPELPFQVTRIVKGKIAGIHKEAKVTWVLLEYGKGKRGAIRLTHGTRFRADKNSEYAGKKHMSRDDLEIGQSVRATFVANTGEVVELRFTAKT